MPSAATFSCDPAARVLRRRLTAEHQRTGLYCLGTKLFAQQARVVAARLVFQKLWRVDRNRVWFCVIGRNIRTDIGCVCEAGRATCLFQARDAAVHIHTVHQMDSHNLLAGESTWVVFLCMVQRWL